MKRKLFNNLKIVFVLISWASVIAIAVGYFQEFNASTVPARIQSGLEVMGYFYFVASFTYANFSVVYSFVRRALVYVVNPSVSWKITTVFKVEDFDDDLNGNIFNDLNEKYENFKFPSYYNKELTKYSLDVNGNAFIISFEEVFESYEIRIISEYKTSYRNSIKELYNTYFEVVDIIQPNFNHPKNVSYLLTIKMEDYNPFYKIYINNLDKIDKLDFSMKYQIGKSDISVRSNKISIASSSISEIKEISQKYIAISNDRLFN